MSGDCGVVRGRVRERGASAADDPAVRAHVAGCEPCADLVADGARLARALEPGAGVVDVAGLLGRVEQAVAADRASLLARLRSWPTGRRRAIVIASCLPLALALVSRVGPRVDLSEYPAWRTLLLVVLLGSLLVRNAWVALRPPHEPLEPPGRVCLFAALALVLVTVAAGAPEPYPMREALCWSSPWGMVSGCFAWGLALGAPVVVTTLLLGRMTTTRALVLAGSAAGLAGNLALHFDCRNVERWHLLAGHATLVVAFVALALAISALRRALER